MPSACHPPASTLVGYFRTIGYRSTNRVRCMFYEAKLNIKMQKTGAGVDP